VDDHDLLLEIRGDVKALIGHTADLEARLREVEKEKRFEKKDWVLLITVIAASGGASAIRWLGIG
jgi:hypothetical protein